MPGNAPVEKVGGPQDQGPWPEEVEEIAVDDRLQRPVQLQDGTTQSVEVRVSDVVEFDPERGGYAVAFQFDDPTLDGGTG